VKKNILFLCTGNSCRSQMAESILRKKGNDFRAYSAGSKPNISKFPDTKGVHPLALKTLEKNGFPTDNLESKSWDNFIKDQEMFDVVITLCDSAFDELKSDTCPFWPGEAARAHWGLFDPDKVEGDEKFVESKFQEAFDIINKRVDALLELDFDVMDPRNKTRKLNEIGAIK
jgi:arsenate reductase